MQAGVDVTGCTRVGDPLNVADQAACCAACKAHANCTHWIYGKGDPAGDCWLASSIAGLRPSSGRTVGGKDMTGGQQIAFATSPTAQLFGRGAGAGDDRTLHADSVSPHVENRESYVPYYYSTDGYAALGVVEDWALTGQGKTNYYQAGYASDGSHITWSPPSSSPFEIYFMPAASLDEASNDKPSHRPHRR